MAKYFAHKPSWRQPRSSGGSAPRAAPVLEMDRSPSGGYSFSGDVYSPPVNRSGRPRGSVPNARSQNYFGPGGTRAVGLRARMAGISAKANMALAFADPNTLQGLLDYGWDDFMNGDLPPPFDFLNTPDWLKGAVPTKGLAPYAPNPNDPPPFFNGEQWVQLQSPIGMPGGGTSIFEFRTFSPAQLFTTRVEPRGGGVNSAYNTFAHFVQNAPKWSLSGGNWVMTIGYDAKFFTHSTNQFLGYGAQAHMEIAVPRVGNAPPVPDMLRPSQVAVGATAAAATLAARTPVRTMMPALYVAPYPNSAIDAVNMWKQIAGIQNVTLPEDGPDRDPVTRSQIVTVPPNKPPVVITSPSHPHKPIGGRTKEKKGRVGAGLLAAAQEMFHAITEYTDLVDALFDAIPARDRCKTRSLVGKTACLFSHVDKIDIGDAIVNIAWNQFEDWAIAKGLFVPNQKAAQARGDRYGFRTLNSMNGVGNLDQLGELYGEFSQSYVNPSKSDLKKFLSNKFGI